MQCAKSSTAISLLVWFVHSRYRYKICHDNSSSHQTFLAYFPFISCPIEKSHHGVNRQFPSVSAFPYYSWSQPNPIQCHDLLSLDHEFTPLWYLPSLMMPPASFSSREDGPTCDPRSKHWNYLCWHFTIFGDGHSWEPTYKLLHKSMEGIQQGGGHSVHWVYASLMQDHGRSSLQPSHDTLQSFVLLITCLFEQ